MPTLIDSPAPSPRRRLLAALALVLGLALLALVGLGPGSERSSAAKGDGKLVKASQAKRPNVVVVMTDDQTVEDLRSMPLTRSAVGRQGVSFKNSFVSYSLCCPSRATFFSGQYAHNHHVLGLEPPTGGYGRFDRDNSLSTWLHQAGYHTGHIGKMMNGYGSDTPADVPPGFDEWYGAVDPTTYRMWGYTLNENGRLRTYGKEATQGQDPRLYQTDVYTNKATDYIRRNSKGSQPFFLSLAYLAPHHEFPRERASSGKTVRPAPRHQGAFANAPLPRPPSFGEPDLTDKPRYVQGRSPPLSQTNIDQMTRNYRDRQASLLAVDEGVRDIVRALKAAGTYDNTYILFTSDNGFLQGEHRVRSGKLLPYEPSIRVPLMIEGPGLPKGRRSSELVGNIDLAPTIMDIADAPSGKPMDGRSLLKFARRPKRHSPRLLLNETGGLKPGQVEPDQGPVAPLRNILTYGAVRTPRYMYIVYKNGSRELYDLKYDPNELGSRHADPRYRETRVALRRELMRLKRCKGRACRLGPKKAIPGPAPKVVGDLGIGPDPSAASRRRARR